MNAAFSITAKDFLTVLQKFDFKPQLRNAVRRPIEQCETLFELNDRPANIDVEQRSNTEITIRVNSNSSDRMDGKLVREIVTKAVTPQ